MARVLSLSRHLLLGHHGDPVSAVSRSSCQPTGSSLSSGKPGFGACPGRTGASRLTGPFPVGRGLLCFRPCPGGLGLRFWASPSCLLGGGPALLPAGPLWPRSHLPHPVSVLRCRPPGGSGDRLQRPPGMGGRRSGWRAHRTWEEKAEGPAWTWPELRGSLGVLSTQPVWPLSPVGDQEWEEPLERPGGWQASGRDIFLTCVLRA